jgi:hypothetical protein
MKNPARFAALFVVALAHAQERLPDPVPVKGTGETPAKSAAARQDAKPTAPAADKPAEATAPASRQLPSREAADTVGEDELKQIVDILRDNYVHPDALSESVLARAGLQGLLDRLGAGARIFTAGSAAGHRNAQFRSEIISESVGYLRLGALTVENIAALDGTLDGFAAKPPPSLVLDLRATPHSTDFELAAECCRRFSPKGRVLFSIKRPKANDEEILTSRDDPKWRGLLTVLVDGNTAGAGEIIAAVLRTHLSAYVIGQQTKGEAAQFEELPLAGGRVLRVAVGEVTLPDATPVFPGGLTPDLVLNVPQEKTDEVLQLALNSGGVAQLVLEKARARMNEAALIAGTNPELDEMQRLSNLRAKGEEPAKLPRDEALQRALDFITSVRVYESRDNSDGKGR